MLEEALDYAENGFLNDLVKRGEDLGSDEDILAWKCQLRRELRQLKDSDGPEREIRTSIAHPFGSAVAQTLKTPKKFSYYNQKFRIMGSFGKCLSHDAKKDLLFMLDHFAIPDNIPAILQKYTGCIQLQGAFLRSVISRAGPKPDKLKRPPSKAPEAWGGESSKFAKRQKRDQG